MSSEINPKYLSAAAIVDQVLKQALTIVTPDLSVAAICSYADSLVEAHAASVHRKEEDIERGIAFPTTVSVNRVIQNFSPSASKDYILCDGDVVKIEVTAHIDGYIASAAHTTVAARRVALAIHDRRADVICAAFHANMVASRMIRPGQTAENVVKALRLVANGFGCSVAEDTFTCQIDRFVTSGNNTFANRFNPDVPVPEITFETGEMYTINCTISSGDGIARATDYDPAIYQRDVNQRYLLKLRSSRTLFSEICQKYSVFPFLMREATGTNSALKAGISECVRSDLLVPFAVTQDKRHGETYVAQFKATVYCHYTGPIRLTRPLTTTMTSIPCLSSRITIPEDSEIGQIIKLDCGSAALPELPRLKKTIPAPIPVQVNDQGSEQESMVVE